MRDLGKGAPIVRAPPDSRSRTALLTGRERTPSRLSPTNRRMRRRGIAASRWDSDLEAFSHKPSDGSFAPLACQPSARTKCLNLRFLSYWAGLLLRQHIISRVKLTCLTTV